MELHAPGRRETPRDAILDLVREHIQIAKERISWYSRMRTAIGLTIVMSSVAASVTSGSALGLHDVSLNIAATVCAGLSALAAGLSHWMNAERRLALYRASLVRLESILVSLSDADLDDDAFRHVRRDYENVAMTMSRISSDDAPAVQTPRTAAPIESIHVDKQSPMHTTDAQNVSSPS